MHCNPADAVLASQFDAFDPNKLVHRLRRQLERAEFDKASGFLVGAVDGEWDERWEVFQPHVHAIGFGVPEAVFATLPDGWPEDRPRV